MWQSLKKLEKIVSGVVLVVGLVIPLLIFLNRFLIPDVSADSLNYHLYLGFKGLNWQTNKYEFFPTGIHNFSPVLDMVGYAFFRVLGYRLGTIFSLLAVYLSIWALYKIYKLVVPGRGITDSVISAFLFVSSFLSFELFLGVGSYYVDGLVAAGVLWAVYWLLKHKTCWSALLMSVLILGKQTNLYLGAAWVLNVIIYRPKKMGWMLLVMAALPLWGYGQNWRLTDNPVFPFYNGVFKSEYFAKVNLTEPSFGGRNLSEKLLWGIYSVWEPARLGQVHDLFHDYKINIYFIGLLPLTVIYLWSKKKDKPWTQLWLFFWSAFLGWSLMFGYLRYALVLEFLGGLMLLICFNKFGRWKYIVYLPLCLLLVLQNKRVVNLSLAYDIGFRPGYFYHRLTYPKEVMNFNKNKIFSGEKPEADIYLNCAPTGMTYDVLSPFTNLPVVNIDGSVYGQMTGNRNYQTMVWQKLEPIWGDKNEIRFVTIAAKSGMNTEYGVCLKNIKDRGWLVDDIKEEDFLGYSLQKIVLIKGHFVQ